MRTALSNENRFSHISGNSIIDTIVLNKEQCLRTGRVWRIDDAANQNWWISYEVALLVDYYASSVSISASMFLSISPTYIPPSIHLSIPDSKSCLSL